jgi:hypothetical protein
LRALSDLQQPTEILSGQHALSRALRLDDPNCAVFARNGEKVVKDFPALALTGDAHRAQHFHSFFPASKVDLGIGARGGREAVDVVPDALGVGVQSTTASLLSIFLA